MAIDNFLHYLRCLRIFSPLLEDIPPSQGSGSRCALLVSRLFKMFFPLPPLSSKNTMTERRRSNIQG